MARGTAAQEAAQPKFTMEAAQPKCTMSCHAIRSIRRHTKRVQQEQAIQSLERQVSSWWSWWLHGARRPLDEIDEEVLQRLRAIEPGIRAQVLAKVRGASRHSARSLVDAETHIKGNAAKHFFPDKPFVDISTMEIRQQQRVRCREPLQFDDAFSLLEGMCDGAPVIVNAGGFRGGWIARRC